MEKRKLIPGMKTPNAVFINPKKIVMEKGEFKKRYKSLEDKKMKIFRGYVLLQELYKKAGVSNSLFQQLHGVICDDMLGVPVVLAKSLPLKYKEVALCCTPLESYYTYGGLSIMLGKTRSYLGAIECSRDGGFDGVRAGNLRLFKLSKAFVGFIDKGFIPFLIDESNKRYADYTVEMQGFKIGFY